LVRVSGQNRPFGRTMNAPIMVPARIGGSPSVILTPEAVSASHCNEKYQSGGDAATRPALLSGSAYTGTVEGRAFPGVASETAE
jgi:hypothetical protein